VSAAGAGEEEAAAVQNANANTQTAHNWDDIISMCNGSVPVWKMET
jgi:hypothetical protein